MLAPRVGLFAIHSCRTSPPGRSFLSALQDQSAWLQPLVSTAGPVRLVAVSPRLQDQSAWSQPLVSVAARYLSPHSLPPEQLEEEEEGDPAAAAPDEEQQPAAGSEGPTQQALGGCISNPAQQALGRSTSDPVLSQQGEVETSDPASQQLGDGAEA